jgi:hypothetical protein
VSSNIYSYDELYLINIILHKYSSRKLWANCHYFCPSGALVPLTTQPTNSGDYANIFGTAAKD